MSKRQRYSDEHKLDAIRLLKEQGYTRSVASKNLVDPLGQFTVITLDGRYYSERTPFDPKWGVQINLNSLFPM